MKVCPGVISRPAAQVPGRLLARYSTSHEGSRDEQSGGVVSAERNNFFLNLVEAKKLALD